MLCVIVIMWWFMDGNITNNKDNFVRSVVMRDLNHAEYLVLEVSSSKTIDGLSIMGVVSLKGVVNDHLPPRQRGCPEEGPPPPRFRSCSVGYGSPPYDGMATEEGGRVGGVSVVCEGGVSE